MINRSSFLTATINDGWQYANVAGLCPKGAVLRAYGVRLPYIIHSEKSRMTSREHEQWLASVISQHLLLEEFNRVLTKWKEHWKSNHAEIWDKLCMIESSLMDGEITPTEAKQLLLVLVDKMPEEMF